MSGSSDNLLWLQAPELANARRRQQLGQQLMLAGSDASPVQSPWQGVARLAQALIGGYERRKGDEAITQYGEQRKAAGEELDAAAAALQGQPMPRAGTPGMGQQMPTAPARQPMAAGPVNPDEDILVRTTWGEGRGEPPVGQASIAAVMRNRARLGGMSLADVAKQPGQFEAWSNPQVRAQMEALDPNGAEYQRILANIRNNPDDPTGGATHFYSPTAQAALGRQPPAWAAGEGKDIGRHRFYTLPFAGQQPQRGEMMPVAGPGGGDGGYGAVPQTGVLLSQAQGYMDLADRAHRAGDDRRANMYMQRAQMAQQLAMQRQPQPKNPILVGDPNDPTKSRYVLPEDAVNQPGPPRQAAVQVNTGENAAAKKIVEAWDVHANAVEEGKRRETLFQNVEGVMDSFKPGATADIRLKGARILQQLGFDTNAPAGEVLSAVQKQIELANVPKGQGQITENERGLIREALPIMGSTPEGLRMLMDMTRKLDARDRDVLRIYNDSARRNGGVPNPLEVREAIAAMPPALPAAMTDRLTPWRAGTPAPAQAAPGAQQGQRPPPPPGFVVPQR